MPTFSSQGGGRPPDTDDILEFGRKAGAGALRHLRWIIIGLIAIVAGATTYYQVEPEQVGLVLRFGKFVRTAQPGPHFRVPFGVERVIKVPVQRQLKKEFGFRTRRAGAQSDFVQTDDTRRESTMLTGDLNVAVVEWIVQYQIRDPYKYVFRVRNVEQTLRDMAEASMRQVIGDRSVTEVLTIGREGIQVEAKELLQQLCDRYDTGIQVLQLVLQDVDPPEPVRPSFNEVNQAIQERERAINEAEAEYNRVIPEARGRAAQAVQSAEGYAVERVNRAKGDTEQFVALQREYVKAPRVTRTRLHLETLTEVLPAAGRRIFVDSEVKGLMSVLPLGAAAAETAGGGK